MTFRRYIQNFVLFICVSLALSSCSKDVDYVPPAGTTDMAITHFSYDKLVIDGEKYDIDLVILPGGRITGWGFDRSTHVIAPADIRSHITDEVNTVIIGSGYHGEGILDNEAAELVDQLGSQGISIHLLPTSDAVNLFNTSPKQGLLAFFHVRN
ncbi:MAG: hypothetical protein GY703_24510 [Gammaproteobacteria bacterium]|nr:hypothetical protein [Gammaproteobacteria bacterium]